MVVRLDRVKSIKGEEKKSFKISLDLKLNRVYMVIVDLQDDKIIEDVAVDGLSLNRTIVGKAAALRYHHPL